MKDFKDLTLEELLQKEVLGEKIRTKGLAHITIYKRIAELYKESNNLQKESEYLEKAVAVENNLKK
jgi:hypothetical protein